MKKVKGSKEGIYIYRVCYIYLLTISCPLHAFLWIQVTIWSHLLTPMLPPISFVVLLSNILHFYILKAQQYDCVHTVLM